MIPATKKQKQLIAINTPTKDIKEEWVQWATGTVEKTSCNDLSFDEANKILIKLGFSPHVPDNWAIFDYKNKKHMLIMAHMRTAQWVKPSKTHPSGEVADMKMLDEFLKSPKSPITKPLQMMEPEELEKIIKAMAGIARKPKPRK